MVGTLLPPRPTFEGAVRLLLEETADVTGEAFFEKLARGVARVVGARYGLVGELLPGKDAVATRAVWGTDGFLPNFTYELDGTPCALALRGGPCQYTSGVADLFPRDALLREMGIEAYLGIEIHTSAGEPLGILVTLHDEPLETIGEYDVLLRIFALRAGTELERGRADAALRRSELRYRSLISRSSDGICILDAETLLVQEANERFLRMTGYSAAEVIGLHLDDLVTGEAASLERGPGGGAAGETLPVERRLRRKDRSFLEVELSSSRVELDDRETLVTNLRDIAERRNAEAAMLRLSNRYELILRSAGEGILGLDRQGLHTFVNPAAAGMFGFEPGELIGLPSHPTWHHTTRDDKPFPSSGCPILGSLRDGEVRRAATDLFHRKDGTGFLAEYVASPIYEAGKQTGTVVVFRDISKEVRLESIAEAVETMNSLGYVFSAVRHELGNPVNSVKMALSVLRENLGRFSPESVRSYVDRSLSELARVEELLASLKSFSLYEDIATSDVPIDEFIGRFLSLFGKDYERRGMAIRHIPGCEAVRIQADPRALRQVLLNLFANAADALAGRPDPTVTIRTAVRDEMVQVRIEDNGCGISPKDLPDLFKPFRTTKASGTGLGLVIARKMLGRFGATIEVDSQLDEGTQVVLT